MARRTQQSTPSACIALVALASCGATDLFAQDASSLRPSEQPWRELVNADLSRVEVQLVALREDGELVARERDGAGVRRPLREVLALLPLESPPSQPSAALGVLTLTTGASLPGQLQGVASVPDAGEPKLRWVSPSLGTIEASLDEVLSLWLDAGPLPRPVRDRLPARTQDLVLLANGDLREGFVELLGSAEGEPQLRIEHAGQTSSVALSLVRALALANPPVAQRGTWAWIDDGSIVALDSAIMLAGKDLELRIDGTAKQSSPAREPIALNPSRVRSILFDRARIRALEECMFTSEASDPARRYTPPAVVHGSGHDGAALDHGQDHGLAFGLGFVELPGPMRVRCELPAGAVKIDGLLELPEDCRTFGSVRVTMTQEGREIARVMLDSTTPTARFQGTLAGSTPLVILVDDAGDGAIEDRVLMRRTLLALEP